MKLIPECWVPIKVILNFRACAKANLFQRYENCSYPHLLHGSCHYWYIPSSRRVCLSFQKSLERPTSRFPFGLWFKIFFFGSRSSAIYKNTIFYYHFCHFCIKLQIYKCLILPSLTYTLLNFIQIRLIYNLWNTNYLL